jgi:hypothetical protein
MVRGHHGLPRHSDRRQGAFKGSAEIDVAEIERISQSAVRQKLVVYSTGKVTGTIRYGSW